MVNIYDKKLKLVPKFTSKSLLCLLFILMLLFPSFILAQQQTVQEIEIVNAKKMNKPFILKIMKTKVGDLFDSVKLNKDLLFLNRLNGILKVEYENLPIDSGSCKISLDITENFTLIPILNIGTTDLSGFYRIGIQEYNLKGKNANLGAFYQYNEFHSFGINYSDPYFFSTKFGIESNVQSFTSREPIFFNNQRATYKYSNTSVELLTRYQVNFKSSFKLGLTFFNENYNYLDGATDPSIPQSLKAKKLLFKLEHQFSNLRYEYFLLNGITNSLNFQYVTADNKFEDKFLIGVNDFSYFKIVNGKGNFATRFRVGLASNRNSPFAPFVVDNNVNIRGVGNLIDRGTGTLVLNSEYRYVLYQKKKFVLQSNVFVDAGSFRKPGGELSDFYQNRNLKLYPGLGIRFIHKTIFNAVFRIDYGYGVINNERRNSGIVFGVGQYF